MNEVQEVCRNTLLAPRSYTIPVFVTHAEDELMEEHFIEDEPMEEYFIDRNGMRKSRTITE